MNLPRRVPTGALNFRRALRQGAYRRPRSLPHAAGEPRRDLLEHPGVPVRVLERGEREVGAALRVAPAGARVLDGVGEGAAGVVEDLAHGDAAGEQVLAGGVDVVDGEGQAARRARL